MMRQLFRKCAALFWYLPGFLLWAAYPPMGEMADALFALAPLMWLSRRAGVRVAAKRWFVNGFIFWFATLAWMPAIVKNGGPWPLVVLGWGALSAYCAAYFAAFGFLSATMWGCVRGRGYMWRIAAIVVAEPVLWAGLEIARSRLFGGFAWNQLGVIPAVAGFGAPAAIGGVFLLSMVVVLINGTVASIAERMLAPVFGERNHWSRSVETLLPILAIWGMYAVSRQVASVDGESDGDERRLRVALVQRNFPCVFDRRDEDVAAIYGKLIANVSPLQPELLVLPESAFSEIGPFGGANAVRFADWLRRTSGARGVVAGGFRKEGGREYNSAALFSEGACEVYDKVHLVPFGEYIPFDKWITPLQKLAPVGSCTPGELKTLDFDGVKLGVAICFEDTDSAQMRRLARMGAQVLVFVTNDSWFSHSDEAVQHAWQSVARAVETGLSVVRVGNSGVTGTVTPRGTATWLVDDKGRPLVDEGATMFDAVRCKARPRATPYVRMGDAPLAMLFALTLALVFYGRFKGGDCRHTPDGFGIILAKLQSHN